MTTGVWKFDGSIAPVFDEHVRKHVPLYDEIHKMITELSGWFLEDGTNVYDIGTSLGQVIANLSAAYPQKIVNYCGIDNSEEMAKKARSRLAANPRIKIISDDVTADSFEMRNASLITSVLTLQFIPQRDRQSLVNKVYDALNTGGAFVFVEKIVGNNARFNEMWVEIYHDMKLRNGLTEEQVFQKAHAIRGVMRPLSVSENMYLLRNAGFKDVDMFFKWGNFAGFIAIK